MKQEVPVNRDAMHAPGSVNPILAGADKPLRIGPLLDKLNGKVSNGGGR